MRVLAIGLKNPVVSVNLLRKIFCQKFNLFEIISGVGNADINSEKFDVLIMDGVSADGVGSVRCAAMAVNCDDADVLSVVRRGDSGVVTYGLNPRSSVTASSIGERGVTFCVQRSFAAADGTDICAQEFTARYSGFELPGDDALPPSDAAGLLLPVATAGLLAGISGETIGKVLTKAILGQVYSSLT